jgi:diguanylate cyclase (GGDEF)-like protein/PAS domain S-box-containing protein
MPSDTDADGPGGPGERDESRAVRAMARGTAHLVGLIDPDGAIAWVSPSVQYLLGYEPAALVGTNVIELIHPADQGMAISMLERTLAESGGRERNWDDADVSGDYRLRQADGRWTPFEVLRSSFTSDPDIAGVLVIGRPIVARRAFDDALSSLARDGEGSEALRRLARYLDIRIPRTMSAFLIAGVEDDWVTDRVPPALLASSAAWEAAMTGGEITVIEDLVAGTHLLEPELRADAAAHGVEACWCLPVPLASVQVYSPGSRLAPDGTALGCLVVWSQQSRVPPPAHLGTLERVGGLAEVALQRRATRRRLEHLLAFDRITGALSRTGFEELVDERRNEPYALIMIDLDDFKTVNDRHGHLTGDEVLRITAQRIQAVLRPGDFLGRLGGDEFALRVAGAERRGAETVAERIVAALGGPLTESGATMSVRASLGIAPYDEGCGYRELLGRADAAMYTAKRAGKGRWKVWAPTA